MPTIGVTIPTLPAGVTNAVSLIFGLITIFYFLTALAHFIAAIGAYGESKGEPNKRQAALSSGVASIISLALLAAVGALIVAVRAAVGA